MGKIIFLLKIYTFTSTYKKHKNRPTDTRDSFEANTNWDLQPEISPSSEIAALWEGQNKLRYFLTWVIIFSYVKKRGVYVLRSNRNLITGTWSWAQIKNYIAKYFMYRISHF